MDVVKKWIGIAAGIILIVAAVFGVTEFTLPAGWATVVQAIAALLLALLQRRLPAPKEG